MLRTDPGDNLQVRTSTPRHPHQHHRGLFTQPELLNYCPHCSNNLGFPGSGGPDAPRLQLRGRKERTVRVCGRLPLLSPSPQGKERLECRTLWSGTTLSAALGEEAPSPPCTGPYLGIPLTMLLGTAFPWTLAGLGAKLRCTGEDCLDQLPFQQTCHSQS